MSNFGPGQQKPPLNTTAILAVGAVIITLAFIIGIKYFIGGGSEDYQAPRNAPDVFRQEAPRVNDAAPALRSASTSVGGGDSLEMFEKTNAGYASEGEEAVKKEETAASTPTARKTAVKKAAGVKAMPPVTTVIPKLQPGKGFGGSSGGSARQGGNPSMPDVNELINSVTKGSNKNTGN